tara:strand:+ start:36073 stop:36237 length:165 start_codon:yes stop_codon:yes gene_type:complete
MGVRLGDYWSQLHESSVYRNVEWMCTAVAVWYAGGGSNDRVEKAKRIVLGFSKS